MRAVGGAGAAPVPPLLGSEPDPAILGQPFFVMGFVEGVIPSDLPRYSQVGFLVDDATPEQRRRMVATGLATMGRIHALDWRSIDLGWLDASGTGEPSTVVQVELYRRYAIVALAGRDHPVLMRAFDWLATNDPQDERIGLSWGDSRLGNVIWRDYEPVAVCDWEACALSPTEADVGWWLMFDRMSFDDLGATRMEGFPTRDEMITLYQDASGREVRDPHYWEIFATMRYCAIMIRLADRMVATGLVPADVNLSVANDVTAALARQLDRGGWV
jgi:aminoglycoside phosphotransferase (APT) family kinase protein